MDKNLKGSSENLAPAEEGKNEYDRLPITTNDATGNKSTNVAGETDRIQLTMPDLNDPRRPIEDGGPSSLSLRTSAHTPSPGQGGSASTQLSISSQALGLGSGNDNWVITGRPVRKRGRYAGSSEATPRKKGEVTYFPPEAQMKCITCGKEYGSWRALFGHLRKHPERDYRGAFPPGTWNALMGDNQGSPADQSIDYQPQQRQQQMNELASNLLNAARVVQARMGLTRKDAEAGPSSRRGLGIDLNNAPPIEPEEDKEITPIGFDLNLPASPESDQSD